MARLTQSEQQEADNRLKAVKDAYQSLERAKEALDQAVEDIPNQADPRWRQLWNEHAEALTRHCKASSALEQWWRAKGFNL